MGRLIFAITLWLSVDRQIVETAGQSQANSPQFPMCVAPARHSDAARSVAMSAVKREFAVHGVDLSWVQFVLRLFDGRGGLVFTKHVCIKTTPSVCG